MLSKAAAKQFESLGKQLALSILEQICHETDYFAATMGADDSDQAIKIIIKSIKNNLK